MKIEALPSWPDGLRDEERALLMLRAAQLRARPDAAVEESQVWLAAFPVGELTFALPLEKVRAAVPLRMVTPVPLSPSHVIGVLRFRGSFATVLSLASLLGVRGWKVDPAVLLVVDVAAADDAAREVADRAAPAAPGALSAPAPQATEAAQARVVAIDCEQIPRAISVSRALVENARTSSRGAVLTEVTLPDLTQLTIVEDVERLLRTTAGAPEAAGAGRNGGGRHAG